LVVGLIAVGVLFIAAHVYVFGIDNLWLAMKYGGDPKKCVHRRSTRAAGSGGLLAWPHNVQEISFCGTK
jgi:hypothetical protein